MRPTRSSRPAAWLFVLGSLVVASASRAETPIPGPPDHWVTDRAAFLSPDVAAALDARLADYDRRTGHQLLVYIDRTTGGVPIEDWAIKAFERWKVGRKGMDDGLVLFIFKDDHKVRIEVGYGLEERVPDAVASRTINDVMVPRIRAGDADGAVRSGTEALVAAIGAPGGVETNRAPQLSAWQVAVGALVLLLIFGFAITHPGLAWLMLVSIGSGRGGYGGGSGGGGGSFSGGGGRSGGGGASGSW